MTGNAIFGLLTIMQLQSSNNTPVLRSTVNNNAWISCKMMRSNHRCWIRTSLSLRNKHTCQGIPQLLRWNTMNDRGEQILLNWRHHSAEKKLICPDRSWESRIINSWFRSRIGGAISICILNKILIATVICSSDESFYTIPFDWSKHFCSPNNKVALIEFYWYYKVTRGIVLIWGRSWLWYHVWIGATNSQAAPR